MTESDKANAIVEVTVNRDVTIGHYLLSLAVLVYATDRIKAVEALLDDVFPEHIESYCDQDDDDVGLSRLAI